MKRTILSVLVLLLSLSGLAQKTSDTAIRFLDIPVDGSPYTFAAKLESHDFTVKKNINGEINYWEGQFNREKCKVIFDSFRGKVYFVVVEFPARNHKAVKEEYNRLLVSLNNSDKYLPNDLYTEIPKDEDIRVSIRNGNTYKASFNYLCPDYFTSSESQFLHRLGYRMMSSAPEDQEEIQEQLKVFFSEYLSENASLEFISEFLKKMESIVYGELILSIEKTGFSYHVLLGYLNDRNAPSNDGRDL